MKKNFSLSVSAHSFASKLSSEKGNPQEYRELAQLGLAIGFKYKAHKDLDKATLKHKIADQDDLIYDVAAVVIYKGLYPETSDKDLSINIEKAASYGIDIIEQKYYKKQDKVIDWKKIIKDFF